MSISRESILAYRDTLAETTRVPEWGGEVVVRGMSSDEGDAFEAENVKANGREVEINRKNLRARLLVRCLYDEAGNRLFGGEDADQLGKQPRRIIDPLYSIAARLSGLTKQDEDELLKNSDGAPNDGSGST